MDVVPMVVADSTPTLLCKLPTTQVTPWQGVDSTMACINVCCVLQHMLLQQVSAALCLDMHGRGRDRGGLHPQGPC